MKNLNLTILSLVLLSFVSGLMAQENPREKGLEAITEEVVKGQLEFLASDWTQGRETGRPGAYLAADYIASLFKIYGLQSGGDVKWTEVSYRERMEGKKPEKYSTYFQEINFIEYSNAGNNELTLSSGTRTLTFNDKTDFQVYSSDVGIEIDAPVVFVGYGYVNKEKGYDDFKGVDVKNKIILCLTGYPGHNDSTSKAYIAFTEKDKDNREPWRRTDNKEKNAKIKGAVAIIEVDPEWDPAGNWETNIPFRNNSRMYEGDKPQKTMYSARMKIPGDTLSDDLTTIYISPRVLNELTIGTDINISRFAEEVKNTLIPASREIPGKKVHIKTSVNSRIVQARNVIGLIPGKDTSNFVVVGAHYDHLGTYDGYIWNGADDNASGTVGMMTIAKAFMASGVKPEKTIIFCAWTGEEKGLLGSQYFVDHLPVPPEKISMYLNYDMISRDDNDDTLGNRIRMMLYTEGYKSFEENTRKYNLEYNLGLEIGYRASARPRGGSDHTAFAEKGIPIIYYFAGFPDQYHQADDHVELVNWDKMVKIIKLGYLNIWDAANGEVEKNSEF